MPHPDDEFHPPTSDDPYWTETSWFTFTVPERGLSGQLYPFFRPNQGITSGGAYFWDASGDQPWNCRYAKNFWHLPVPDQPLSDIALPNGIRYRCVEPQQKYEIGYTDPDGDLIDVDLVFDAVSRPNYLGESHLDQPGRYTGTVRLGDDVIEVDSFGFRDRSWSVRSQFGPGLAGSPAPRGGYSYATASADDGFHMISMDFTPGPVGEGDCIAIHGYLSRGGEWAKVTSGRRDVLARDAATGAPTRVRIEGTDELERSFVAEGECLNKIGIHLNPNLFTWNCLTRWELDGLECWGEDHDNWSAPAATEFFRRHLFGESSVLSS